MSNYYEILGVDKNATGDQIKKAYRDLSKKFHPDLNKSDDAEEKFKKIAEAYETLGDEKKRSEYDRFGTGGNPFGGGFGFDDIFSQFGDIFGSRFGGKRENRGGDLRMRVDLNINEIITGVNKKLKYKRQQKCKPCSGAGGSDVTTCQSCGGSGMRVVTQNTPFGQVRTQTHCGNCGGSGKKINNICNSCRGDGTVTVEETVDVKIPAGVSNGMQLKMDGYGNEIGNGRPGDLYIFVNEIEHEEFKREGGNILVDKWISVIDAICGANIKVKSPHGDLTVYVEPGTEHDKVIRISGKGVPDINYGLGDFLIRFKIKIPKNLDLDDRAYLEKLRGKI